MKVAIPITDGRLSAHFGHCERFSIITVDPETNQIVSHESAVPPAHEPGSLPRWLHEMGATHIITGGMGMRAQALFAQFGIEVLVGAPFDDPENIVRNYLDGKLVLGSNVCDH
jgi:ATP-binding protein involved in chromosome partitioning